MKRVLVIGASGLVGSHVARVFKAYGWTVTGTYRSNRPVDNPLLVDLGIGWEQLNLENGAQPCVEHLVTSEKPDVIVNCMAWADVNGCQRMPMRSHCLNQMIPARIAALAAALRIQYVFISSGYVFGGAQDSYTELDLPFVNCDGPLNVYGDDKQHAEVAIRGICPPALIVRTVGVFGQDPGNKCFTSRLIRALQQGKQFKFDGSTTSNWTWAQDLAEDIRRLVDERRSGIVHSAGQMALRRDTFARMVATAVNRDIALLDPTQESGDVPRPMQCVLRTIRTDVHAYWDSNTLPVMALQRDAAQA